MVKTLEEAWERIRKAMEAQQTPQAAGFSPGIENIRQVAGRRRPPQRQGRQLPTAR